MDFDVRSDADRGAAWDVEAKEGTTYRPDSGRPQRKSDDKE